MRSDNRKEKAEGSILPSADFVMESNKRIGSRFERQVCDKLAKDGWWVHFLAPGANGAQPFDVIAMRGKRVLALDCKTCRSKYFSYDRIETNQRMAFDMLRARVSDDVISCGFVILHNDKIVFLPYAKILADEAIGKRSYDLEARK